MKIRIDFNSDPNLSAEAKQVVFIEGTFETINPINLIGKVIIGIEKDSFHNCLVLELKEDEESDEK